MRAPPTTGGICDWPRCLEKAVWRMDWLDYCDEHQHEASANRAKIGGTVVTPIYIGDHSANIKADGS